MLYSYYVFVDLLSVQVMVEWNLFTFNVFSDVDSERPQHWTLPASSGIEMFYSPFLWI